MELRKIKIKKSLWKKHNITITDADNIEIKYEIISEILNLFKYNNIILIADYIEKIIRKNNFQIINTKNIDNINENIQNFYENLSDDGKSSFTSNLDLDNILNLSKENYYLFKSKNNNRSYLILLLDVNEKVIYSFNSIN